MPRISFTPTVLLSLIATGIVLATIWYARHLSEELAKEQKLIVENWIEAQNTILKGTSEASLNLASKISVENNSIPIIGTDENDEITGEYRNLDSALVAADSQYLQKKLKEFKALHDPFLLVISERPYMANKYYYGESRLQEQLKYYPYVQLLVVALFLLLVVVFQKTRYRSAQNQLWAGLAKETAHQLGTPLTSMQGWAEMLKDVPGTETIVPEMERDLKRLQLISERFSKIGSTPKQELCDVGSQVGQMLAYMKKRASGKVQMEMVQPPQPVQAMVSPALFDWVIENLLKNALDALDGKGKITVHISESVAKVNIDVTDNGKGIPKQEISKVFNPGFTTKKRGWGLGLTLCRRIIEQYHKGEIFVRRSEPGQGTTFRIVLNKL